MSKACRPTKESRRRVLRQSLWTCDLRGPNCVRIATTVDHWLPRSAGGGNNRGNLRAACEPCNRDKSGMMPDDWLAWKEQPGDEQQAA